MPQPTDQRQQRSRKLQDRKEQMAIIVGMNHALMSQLQRELVSLQKQIKGRR